jgi:two-component system sensor histidine kinase YesM
VFSAPSLYRNSLILLILLCVVAFGVYAWMVCRDVHNPLKNLERAFDRLAEGEMDFTVDESRHGEFGQLMRSFNQMLGRLRGTVQQLYQQRILMQQAQLKQMQSQINPHFLYNSFFILNNMIAMEDYDAAAMFSKRLGQYFRYVTRDARGEVPLREEYDHVRSYLDVQGIRFGKRLSIALPEMSDAAGRVIVPRLSLQPIVENAFLHSLEHMRGMGELIVRVKEDEAGVTVEVENNGAEDMREKIGGIVCLLDDEDPSVERSGLKNVHQRLKMTQGRGLDIRFEEPDRFIVRMTITKQPRAGEK